MTAAGDGRKWLARYEEGYISVQGKWEVIGTKDVRNHGWASPVAAVEIWTERGDFALPGVTRYQNGKQQIEDVRDRPEFATVGVRSIWRRITFRPIR